MITGQRVMRSYHSGSRHMQLPYLPDQTLSKQIETDVGKINPRQFRGEEVETSLGWSKISDDRHGTSDALLVLRTPRFLPVIIPWTGVAKCCS